MPNWPAEIKKSQVSYDGEDIARAVPLRLGELKPGFPPVGVAGSIRAYDYASDEFKSWLKNPKEVLLDKSQCPDTVHVYVYSTGVCVCEGYRDGGSPDRHSRTGNASRVRFCATKL